MLQEQSPSCGNYLNDIGFALHAKLSEDEVHRFLTAPWKPLSGYEFMTINDGTNNRKFNASWLQEHEWLVYSDKDNGAYCKYCVLFGPQNAGKGFRVCHLTCLNLKL